MKGYLVKNSRLSSLYEWLCTYFKVDSVALEPLTGDAGFRIYYRFMVNNVSYIGVDAVPDKSNNLAFVNIQKALRRQQINVPQIVAYDLEQGLLCLSDFGDVLFSDYLTQSNIEQSYQSAIKLLPAIASTKAPQDYSLPLYDAEFIHLECNIFTQWLLSTHLSIILNQEELFQLKLCFDSLASNAIEQPQVVMHRDFHSRNLMLLNAESRHDCTELQLGVIDFQDAVIGPITYDVVSLLRDCYVKWPNESVDNLFKYFCQLIDIDKNYPDVPLHQWQRWFDLMGMQRHVKASGIFARLLHRDGKSGYLKDIPLTLSYIVDISAKYPEFNFLHELVLNKVIPALTAMELKQTSVKGHE